MSRPSTTQPTAADGTGLHQPGQHHGDSSQQSGFGRFLNMLGRAVGVLEDDFGTDEELDDVLEPVVALQDDSDVKQPESKHAGMEWSNRSFQGERKEFVISEEMSHAANHCDNEIDFFSLFFTDVLVQTIVNATNKYGKKHYPSSWSDTTLGEIRKFYAVMIYMGTHQSPKIESYWSTPVHSPFVTMVFHRAIQAPPSSLLHQ